jgi:non-specific serine/threonine protein kinase/serine/threonine-protein kinase
VELLILICQAIQHAHQKGVVHRDLKPSNVLVSGDRSTPVPKIIDFGIAKAIGMDTFDGLTVLTRADQAIGTAAYMSPEQAGYGQMDVDTRSDVYSLGVMLYELLASCLPVDPKQVGYAHFLALLANGDLRAAEPSKRIFSLEDAVDAAAARDTTTAGLRRALEGDLDWIVIKALEVDRARRYETAEALAEDLRRYLRGAPVSAHPPMLSYQLRKFVRRYRVEVGAAALLMVVLMAGTVGTTAGMVRARRAEASARTEAATAERYSKFLVNMFEAAAPEHSKGRDLTAREILDRGALRIRQELANEPLLEARLLATIGWVDTRLGRYPEARPMLDEAVALARGQGDKGRFDLAQALIRRGQVVRYLNDPGKAESDDREALSILERAYGPNHINLEPAISELGLLLRTRDPEQALRLYRRSYALLTAAHGEADGDAAVLLQNIGSIHARASRFQEAKEAYERALPLLRRHFGARDPHVGAVLGNLSFVYRNLGDYAQAFEAAQRGLEVDASVSGPDHPDVGIAWLNLARISDKLGELRLALEQIDRAIEIFVRRFAPGHPLRIQAANFKAGFLIELRRLGEARKTLDNFSATEDVSLEAKRALLSGQVILADIERLDRRLQKSQDLARQVLADPAVRGDRRLEADAHWAHAYALAMLAKRPEAEAERASALDIEFALAQGTAFPGVFADAKYHLCAGDAAQALVILREAVAKNFHDPIILNDPTFAALRENPDFAPIAAAVAPRFRQGATATQ